MLCNQPVKCFPTASKFSGYWSRQHSGFLCLNNTLPLRSMRQNFFIQSSAQSKRTRGALWCLNLLTRYSSVFRIPTTEHRSPKLAAQTFRTWKCASVHSSANRGMNTRSDTSLPARGAILLINCNQIKPWLPNDTF